MEVCRRATPSHARRRRWYFGPMISRRLTTRGRVHAWKRRITLSNVLAEKIRILKYERANTRVLTKFVKFERAKNIRWQDRFPQLTIDLILLALIIRSAILQMKALIRLHIIYLGYA